mmetsp:Transcript_84219/g.234569  ORF Transcript_84219/g.234569 Transcript_84219/m.234569 type:complete len:83 (-) Transcript_84219:397-645(-)
MARALSALVLAASGIAASATVGEEGGTELAAAANGGGGVVGHVAPLRLRGGGRRLGTPLDAREEDVVLRAAPEGLPRGGDAG